MKHSLPHGPKMCAIITMKWKMSHLAKTTTILSTVSSLCMMFLLLEMIVMNNTVTIPAGFVRKNIYAMNELMLRIMPKCK